MVVFVPKVMLVPAAETVASGVTLGDTIKALSSTVTEPLATTPTFPE